MWTGAGGLVLDLSPGRLEPLRPHGLVRQVEPGRGCTIHLWQVADYLRYLEDVRLREDLLVLPETVAAQLYWGLLLVLPGPDPQRSRRAAAVCTAGFKPDRKICWGQDQHEYYVHCPY